MEATISTAPIVEESMSSARLLLALTALCWASYPVIVKLLGESVGGPLDTSLVIFIRFSMIAVFSLPLLPPEALPWNKVERAGQQIRPVDQLPLWLAGLEIALVGTTATQLNTWGIEHTTAIRAALLLSSVNILTPSISVLLGSSPEDRNVSLRTWIGCAAAFLATAWAISGGLPSEGGSGPVSGLKDGDLAVLAASACYALLKVQVGAKAKLFPPEALAASRLVVAPFLAGLIFLGSHVAEAETDWFGGVARLPPAAWGFIFLSALVPGFIATVLQAKGQRVVPPAQAQTIYAAVPLVAAVYDFIFLHEPIEDREVLAGVVVVAAAAFSAAEDR